MDDENKLVILLQRSSNVRVDLQAESMGGLAHIVVGGPTRQAAYSFVLSFPGSFVRLSEIEDERWIESWDGRMWASGSWKKGEWDCITGYVL